MNTGIEEKMKSNKHLKLLKTYNNNIKISDMNLKNKYADFEDSKFDESKTLLYEIEEAPINFKRYSRGEIVRVKFGVNIGSEFSGEHYAIVISKKDTMLNPVVHVIPLTSKKHNYNLKIGKVIYCKDKINELQQRLLKCNLSKEKRELKKIITYYSNRENTISYACIKHLKTVSKLSVCKPLNKYDYINNLKVPIEIMQEIDKSIISEYTLM